MADKFEIKRVFITLAERMDRARDSWNRSFVVHDELSNEAWEEASQLASEGWELVGSVPLIESFVHRSGPLTYSLTGAYVLLFKRRIEE